MIQSDAIGFFDSGVGGLGVLTEARRLLPDSDFVYLADHAHAPYGIRSLAQVADRAHRVAEWMIGQGCRVVTIACNTASAAALHALRASYPDIAFVGMEPAIKPAVAATGRRRVGVVATAATFQGTLFSSVVDRFAGDVVVTTAACPSWVTLVETGTVAGERAEREVAACLAPLIEAQVDVVVLACTHFPVLGRLIRREMGPQVVVIDPATAVASQTARVATATGRGLGTGRVRLFSTAAPDVVEEAAARHGISAPASLLPLP